MGNMGGIANAITVIGILDIMLRLFAYIAFISLSIKGIQALNVYIQSKRSKM